MKKFLFTVCFAVLLIAGKTTAQQASHSTITDNMKWMHINGGHPNNIHIRAVRDFLKRYKDVPDAEWVVIDEGFVVKYAGNGRRCRTVYNKNGLYLYTIRQYAEALMPRDVRAIVKSRYYDYIITLIEEIERPSTPIVYVVHIEDATTLKNVQVSEGAIEIMDEYIKG